MCIPTSAQPLDMKAAFNYAYAPLAQALTTYNIVSQRCINRQSSAAKIIKNDFTFTLLQSRKDDSDDESPNVDGIDSAAYQSPQHSESFRRHLESVKSSWPYGHDTSDGGDNEDTSDGGDNEKQSTLDFFDGGVQCPGEPAVDPSRMIQRITDDGESDWI